MSGEVICHAWYSCAWASLQSTQSPWHPCLHVLACSYVQNPCYSCVHVPTCSYFKALGTHNPAKPEQAEAGEEIQLEGPNQAEAGEQSGRKHAEEAGPGGREALQDAIQEAAGSEVAVKGAGQAKPGNNGNLSPND